jgi:hypothetical protein
MIKAQRGSGEAKKCPSQCPIETVSREVKRNWRPRLQERIEWERMFRGKGRKRGRKETYTEYCKMGWINRYRSMPEEKEMPKTKMMQTK